MFLRIEATSGVPITRQLMDQIRAHVSARGLVPGDRLPSVRELARELAVNQNTVLKVYERLTGEGILERRHGNGTFVAASPSAKQVRREADEVCRQIEALLRRALVLGVEKASLRQLVDQAVAEAASGEGQGGGEQTRGRRA